MKGALEHKIKNISYLDSRKELIIKKPFSVPDDLKKISLRQSVWIYTHLMQVSVFKMQVSVFKMQMRLKVGYLYLNTSISI